jgi:hypothetical protein
VLQGRDGSSNASEAIFAIRRRPIRTAIKPEPFQCAFPDFDDEGFIVDATNPQEAAKKAADRWERDIEDFRVLHEQDTLLVSVTRQSDRSCKMLEVMGHKGLYVAKVWGGPKVDD